MAILRTFDYHALKYRIVGNFHELVFDCENCEKFLPRENFPLYSTYVNMLNGTEFEQVVTRYQNILQMCDGRYLGSKAL